LRPHMHAVVSVEALLSAIPDRMLEGDDAFRSQNTTPASNEEGRSFLFNSKHMLAPPRQAVLASSLIITV